MCEGEARKIARLLLFVRIKSRSGRKYGIVRHSGSRDERLQVRIAHESDLIARKREGERAFDLSVAKMRRLIIGRA